MSYTSGSLVTLSNGRFVKLTVVEGNASSITFQLYDAQMQGTFWGSVDTGSVDTSGLLPVGTRLSGVEVIADQNGGFVVAYNTLNLNGQNGPNTTHMEVKAYAGDSSLRLSAQVDGSVGTSDPLAAQADNSVAFVAGTVLRIADPDGWFRTALDPGAAPYNLAVIPAGIIASYVVDGEQHQLVVGKDGTILSRGAALAVTTGTASADTLVGGSGADSISGGAGNDVLYGQGGYDALQGGAGGDKFMVSTDGSVDRLVDFNVGQGDSLLVLNDQGAIPSGVGSLLMWRQTTDVLTWDPDGNAGGQVAVPVAVLEGPDQQFTRASFAAGFQPAMVRTISTAGQQTDQVFDWGSQSFDTVTTVYTVGGVLKSYEVRYDTGAYSLRTVDVTNAHTDWATTVAEYDRLGGLSAYTVLKDDNARTLWIYDTENTKTYERVLEEYDALGRLSQQSAKLDDGTAWERHIDTYDTHPWAYYIENFASTGARLNLTYFDANGGVITV